MDVLSKHRHITETGLTLLAQASMPLKFWWDAFLTSANLINGLPTDVLAGKSPMELLLKKSLDLNSLKIFGCVCYPYLRPFNAQKFQFHTNRCVYLGFSSVHKGYKCLNPSGKIIISRHVIFNEADFAFASSFPTDSCSPVPTAQPQPTFGWVPLVAPRWATNPC